MAGKNRTFRTDVLTHEKTAGLHPLDRDLLFFQVIASNIAGVLERSIARMARECGGGTTQKQVRASLLRLQRRGIVVWWPDLEMVWAVEAADEQGRTPNGWKGVQNRVETLPQPVREAFWKRYKDRPGAPPSKAPDEGPPEGPTEGAAHTGSSIEERVSRGKEAPKGSSKPEPRKTRAEQTAWAVGHIRERIRWGEVKPPHPPGRRDPLGFPTLPDRLLRQRLEEGATANEIVSMFGRLSARITRGELEADMWGGVALSGYYGALRDDLPIRGKSRPGLEPTVSPRCETEAEAMAYYREHKRVPDAWRWDQDGRGNAKLVRIGGAA